MGRSKFAFKEELKNIPKDKAVEYLNKQVFDTEHFAHHVNQVSTNLKLDQRLVRDVLVSYFTNIFFMINTVRKIKTKINLFGFFSLSVLKGSRF